MDGSPGECVLKTMFQQFTISANRKINLLFEHQVILYINYKVITHITMAAIII